VTFHILLRRSRLLIIVDPSGGCQYRNHGPASQLDQGECALLGQAAHGLGADAAELAGGFVEVPQ
jgi:hypothetical protein